MEASSVLVRSGWETKSGDCVHFFEDCRSLHGARLQRVAASSKRVCSLCSNRRVLVRMSIESIDSALGRELGVVPVSSFADLVNCARRLSTFANLMLLLVRGGHLRELPSSSELTLHELGIVDNSVIVVCQLRRAPTQQAKANELSESPSRESGAWSDIEDEGVTGRTLFTSMFGEELAEMDAAGLKKLHYIAQEAIGGKLLEEAVEAGEVEDMGRGSLLSRFGVPVEKEQELELFTRGAEAECGMTMELDGKRHKCADAPMGSGDCFTKADGFDLKFGVKHDEVKAVEWYSKAANQGHAGAQCMLGFCYANGDGVQQDMAKAAEWFSKAANQGDATAQLNVAICYENGDGVDQDMGMAVEWYTRAAKQGHAEAQWNVGVCFENGDGVDQDMGMAVEWYTRAAKQGHAEAQFRLGFLRDWRRR